MTSTTPFLVASGAIALSLTFPISQAHGDVFSITSLSAEVEAEADAYDTNTDTSDSNVDNDSASSFAELDINADASAFANEGSGSGSASVWGALSATSMQLTTSGFGDGFGDDIFIFGSGYGSGQFEVVFTVNVATTVRIDLACGADGLDNIGNGSVEFYANDSLVDSVSTDFDVFDESTITLELVPGNTYRATGYGAGSGISTFGGGSSGNGSGSVTITALCTDFGPLALGDNAFDTTNASGFSCDLTGICDPGDFGLDIIENAAYYTFTPDVTTTYTFSTCNQAAFDTRLAVLTEACNPESTLACLDDTTGCANYTTELSVDLEAGVTYSIVIGGFDSTHLGTGTLTITALPIILSLTNIDATVITDAYAYYCGDNDQNEESDEDHQELNPSSLDDFPANLFSSASTCCSDGSADARIDASLGINSLRLITDASAGACGDFDGFCSTGSSYGDTSSEFTFELSTNSDLTMSWSLFGDVGGSANVALRDSSGTWLIDEYADFNANDGTTTLELSAGVYRVSLSSWASGDPFYCGGMGAVGSGIVVIDVAQRPNPNDINGDGLVNGADLTLLLGSWGICIGCAADLNGDFFVDGIDLALLLGSWDF